MTLSIEFEHPRAGWLVAYARDPESDVDATIVGSRLADCLAELLDAASTLCLGATDARCAWPEEPGEYRWILHRREDDLEVRVVLAREWLGQEADDLAKPVLMARVKLLRFVRILLSQSQRLVDEMGEEAFAREWRRPFPFESFARLQRSLRSARSEGEGLADIDAEGLGDIAEA